MPADVFQRIPKGETRPLYGSASVADPATLTVQGSPTFTLYDASGAVVSGFNGVAATGFDAGALATVRAWYLLATAGLAAGFYTGVISFHALGSDGLVRVFEPSIAIEIAALAPAGPSYLAWPTVADVQPLLDACSITLRVTGAAAAIRIQRALTAVTDEVGRETRRQFVADATDTVRVYDGSGGPRQKVDEMVSLTAVTIIGLQSDPGYTLGDTILEQRQGEPKTWIITARGSLPAYATEALYLPWRQIFPEGRQNVQVTGKFGYGATVPVDLWEAVAGEAAFRLASEVSYRPIGRVSKQQIGPSSTTYHPDEPTLTGWHKQFAGAVKRYRRRGDARVQARPRMI